MQIGSTDLLRVITDPKCVGLTSETIPEVMDFGRWRSLGATLARIKANMPWVWGDYLNFGERQYGDKYTQVEDEFGLDPDHAKNMCSVAKRVPMRNRRADLKWSHHREIAKLEAPQQREWLQKAADGEWPVSELKAHLRDAGVLPAKPDSNVQWAAAGEARIAELEAELKLFAEMVLDFLSALDADDNYLTMFWRSKLEDRADDWLPGDNSKVTTG